ncbi:MAG TPA: serine/threonine-protein kinase [Polyangiaceae bacterium]|nr:serine/threonine-protein kinase [Polyangiaceae bacterium]
MALSIGDTVDGKYQIVRLLGEGGMGAVYEGLNTRIHRKVAIKVLHGNVASSADAVQRFEREAQAAGRIGSKHIVEVLDLGDLPNGDRYMVMEFMDGQSLADRIRDRGHLTPQELYPIAVQLLDGLAAAHAAGIVHRDLKPDNVFLLPTGKDGTDFVKILDFGISKFNSLGGEFSMTRTGAVMGTPYYMSPEQAKGARDLDQRTDIYAAGVILYEALSGRVPFNAETFNELLFKIVLEDAPPLASILPDVNPAFVEVVQKAMSRDLNQRFQTASDFKAALNVWSQRNSVVPLGISDPSPTFGAPRPSSTVMGGTAGAWASSTTLADDKPPVAPKKKGMGLWVGLGAGVLALVAAGVGLSMKSGAEEAAAQAEAERVASERAETEQRASIEAERKAAEQARAEAEKLASEAEALRKKAEQDALQRAADKLDDKATDKPGAVAKASSTPAKGTTVVAAPTTPAPAAAKPAAEPAKPAAATEKPSSSTSTGRTIRSTL